MSGAAISAVMGFNVEDRQLLVGRDEVVKTAWVSIDRCSLGNRAQMIPEAIEKKFRKLLCQGDRASWPTINGYWREDGYFVVCDGRHEFVASLMIGRTEILVAWVERSDQQAANGLG